MLLYLPVINKQLTAMTIRPWHTVNSLIEIAVIGPSGHWSCFKNTNLLRSHSIHVQSWIINAHFHIHLNDLCTVWVPGSLILWGCNCCYSSGNLLERCDHAVSINRPVQIVIGGYSTLRITFFSVSWVGAFSLVPVDFISHTHTT